MIKRIKKIKRTKDIIFSQNIKTEDKLNIIYKKEFIFLITGLLILEFIEFLIKL